MNLPEEIKTFMDTIAMKPAPKKTTTTSGNKARKHNHFPQGKTGYVPKSCSDPVNIKTAKRE